MQKKKSTRTSSVRMAALRTRIMTAERVLHKIHARANRALAHASALLARHRDSVERELARALERRVVLRIRAPHLPLRGRAVSQPRQRNGLEQDAARLRAAGEEGCGECGRGVACGEGGRDGLPARH